MKLKEELKKEIEELREIAEALEEKSIDICENCPCEDVIKSGDCFYKQTRNILGRFMKLIFKILVPTTEEEIDPLKKEKDENFYT